MFDLDYFLEMVDDLPYTTKEIDCKYAQRYTYYVFEFNNEYAVYMNVDISEDVVTFDVISNKHNYMACYEFNFTNSENEYYKAWKILEKYVLHFNVFKNDVLKIDENLPYTQMFCEYMLGKRYIEEYDEMNKNKPKGVSFLTTNHPECYYHQTYKTGYDNDNLYGCVVEYDSNGGLSFEKVTQGINNER